MPELSCVHCCIVLLLLLTCFAQLIVTDDSYTLKSFGVFVMDFIYISLSYKERHTARPLTTSETTKKLPIFV